MIYIHVLVDHVTIREECLTTLSTVKIQILYTFTVLRAVRHFSYSHMIH